MMEFPSGFILELWEKAGFEVKRSGSSWVSPDCPRCGRARTGHRVSLDPEKNVWKCFGEGCGAQGGVKDFCEEVGWDFREILEEFGLKEKPEAEKRKEERSRGSKEREPIGLASLLTRELSPEAEEYLRVRGIDPELVEGYVFGIDPGSHEYAGWLWEHGYRFFVPQYSGREIVSGRFRLAREPGEGR